MTKEEFETHIDELIDQSKCVEPALLYLEEEIQNKCMVEAIDGFKELCKIAST